MDFSKPSLLVPMLRQGLAIDALEGLLSPQQIELLIMLDGHTSLPELADLLQRPLKSLFPEIERLCLEGVVVLYKRSQWQPNLLRPVPASELFKHHKKPSDLLRFRSGQETTSTHEELATLFVRQSHSTSEAATAKETRPQIERIRQEPSSHISSADQWDSVRHTTTTVHSHLDSSTPSDRTPTPRFSHRVVERAMQWEGDYFERFKAAQENASPRKSSDETQSLSPAVTQPKRQTLSFAAPTWPTQENREATGEKALDIAQDSVASRGAEEHHTFPRNPTQACHTKQLRTAEQFARHPTPMQPAPASSPSRNTGLHPVPPKLSSTSSAEDSRS